MKRLGMLLAGFCSIFIIVMDYIDKDDDGEDCGKGEGGEALNFYFLISNFT